MSVEKIEEMKPKALRTLRNNLNNRIESFKTSGEGAKNLQKSHMLFGKTEGECEELLNVVYREIKKRRTVDA